MTQPDVIRSLLDAVSRGQLSPEAAFEQLKYLDFEPIEEFAKVDHHRPLRTGFPEVIWGPGKTVDHIVQIMRSLHQRNPVVMATRITPEVYSQIRQQIPGAFLSTSRPASVLWCPSTWCPHHPGTIGVLAAGTADLPVAEEAAVTAELSALPSSGCGMWE